MDEQSKKEASVFPSDPNRDKVGKAIVLWENLSKVWNFKICPGKTGLRRNSGS